MCVGLNLSSQNRTTHTTYKEANVAISLGTHYRGAHIITGDRKSDSSTSTRTDFVFYGLENKWEQLVLSVEAVPEGKNRRLYTIKDLDGNIIKKSNVRGHYSAGEALDKIITKRIRHLEGVDMDTVFKNSDVSESNYEENLEAGLMQV